MRNLFISIFFAVLLISGCSFVQPKMQNIHTCRQMVKEKNPLQHIAFIYQKASNAKYINVGTGVIAKKEGLILTVAHTFLDERQQINKNSVVFARFTDAGKTMTLPAKIIWSSVSHDAAILRVDYQFESEAETENVALDPGDCVYMIGFQEMSPKPMKIYGNYLGSINLRVKQYGMADFVELHVISAHITLGISGGPVFNSSGNIVGIVNKIVNIKNADGSQVQMTAFVPIEYFKKGLKK